MAVKIKVVKPEVTVNRERVLANINTMMAKAKLSRVKLRPHFKTHQSREVGRWFKEAGVTGITVSSVQMAEKFAADGWKDITIAVLTNLREWERTVDLSRRVDIGILVDSPAVVDALPDVQSFQGRVWLKIDTGYGRTGIIWNDIKRIEKTVKAIQNRGMQFVGILTHSGHTYKATSVGQIKEIYRQTVERMGEVKEMLISSTGIKDCLISIGDTPSVSVMEELYGTDEVRPGNFVFYDLMQYSLGVCGERALAVTVACPVIGVYPEENKLVLYGGAVHLSKEFLTDDKGNKIFGYLAKNKEDGKSVDRNAPVVSLSQEHGIVSTSDAARYKAVDIVHVFPVHSCLTCNLYDRYLDEEGGEIEK